MEYMHVFGNVLAIWNLWLVGHWKFVVIIFRICPRSFSKLCEVRSRPSRITTVRIYASSSWVCFISTPTNGQQLTRSWPNPPSSTHSWTSTQTSERSLVEGKSPVFNIQLCTVRSEWRSSSRHECGRSCRNGGRPPATIICSTIFNLRIQRRTC